ncbi:hypothetical protein [Actinokineospora sp. HUAS TT18]|uniref:hypothetical protein n=1 Tax=Actinokineospora sp. HUAS TT18 TaxID=3447451 RepID=UPI003F5264CB
MSEPDLRPMKAQVSGCDRGLVDNHRTKDTDMVAIPLTRTAAQPHDGALITATRFLGNLVVAALSVVLMGEHASH